MAIVKTKDGTRIFYKDQGFGKPIVFSHGWPLSADSWDNQLVFFARNGFRTVAHDRRSHGRSDQTWQGNNIDHYADDLATLIEELGLKDIVLVGHSTGGGEVVRYIARHGTSRVAKLVLVGAVPPLMLKTDDNPHGTPIEVFDSIRKSTLDNRAQFFHDITVPFYGFNRAGTEVSEGIRQSFWMQGMMGGLKGQLDCIHEFSEVDYSDDLKKIDVPTLIVHGDDDQIVPIAASAVPASKIIPNARLKIYSGGSHGLAQIQHDQFNADLLEFIRES